MVEYTIKQTLNDPPRPGLCPVLSDDRPCEERIAGVLVVRDVKVAGVCESHGRLIEALGEGNYRWVPDAPGSAPDLDRPPS